jgi:hypothetical protein
MKNNELAESKKKEKKKRKSICEKLSSNLNAPSFSLYLEGRRRKKAPHRFAPWSLG